MFWKNAAWSWDDAAGDDDDDGGYLLAADLRRTPDSTPDSDLNHIVDAASSTGASTASLTKSTSTSATSTSGPKDLISSLHSEVTSYSSHASTLYTNTSQQYAGRDGSAMQRMEVSPLNMHQEEVEVRCSQRPYLLLFLNVTQQTTKKLVGHQRVTVTLVWFI